MLSVPWHLPNCHIEEVNPKYEGIDEYYSNNVFEELENTKNEVGVFRIERGAEEWRRNVNATDTNVNMPLTLPPDKVINRAYYKMVEIIRTCIIQPCRKSFHMCEAPGGFVQACMEEFKTKLNDVHCISMSGSDHIEFSSVLPQSGVTVHKIKNGDVTDQEVQSTLVNLVGKNSCDLITADGAIDNDNNPEMTETNTATLLANEIKLAFDLQSPGGTFVIKLFGLRLKLTYELLAMLCHSYENVHIVKPFSSRAVNDERYVVCQNFQLEKKLSFALQNEKVCKLCDINPQWLNVVLGISTNFAGTQLNFLRRALTFKNGKGKGRGRGKGNSRGSGRSRGRGISKPS